MIRKHVYTGEVNPYSFMHFKADNDAGFDVRADNDGQTLEEHITGIDYIASVIMDGHKITPILVEEVAEGRYRLLDGFKRYMAQKKLRKPVVECFVVTSSEVDIKRQYKYLGLTMEAVMGGQSYFDTRIPLIEGKDTVSEPSLEQIDTLYHGEHIRIEYSECFHLHWGDHGKYRLKLGMKDFMDLCDAFAEVKL
jgi:hypothetical protein